MTTVTASKSQRRYQKCPPIVREEAIQLHRMSWGSGTKLAKYLGRRHGLRISPYTVTDWIRDVPQDLDPLAAL